MRKNLLLAIVTVLGSALGWWPAFILQNSLRPSSIPAFAALAFIALLSGFSTLLSGGYWVRFWLLSSIGTFFGFLSGGIIWPSEDGIAQSYLFYGTVAATCAVLVVTLIAGLTARFLVRMKES